MTTTEPFTEALAAFHDLWRTAPFGRAAAPSAGRAGRSSRCRASPTADRSARGATTTWRPASDYAPGRGRRKARATALAADRRALDLRFARLLDAARRRRGAAWRTRDGEPFDREWFDSMFGMDRQALIAGGAQALRAAVADRH